jgi:hypothetical protein
VIAVFFGASMNNRSRIVLLGLFAVLVAVWGASASLSLARSDGQNDRRAAENDRPPAPALFDVEEASSRIRNRQRESPAPREGGRNPFEYARLTAPPAPAAPEAPSAEAIALPVTPPPPPFTLSGIADKTGEDGAMVRTAVISSPDRLFFVKVGDNVTSRYTVSAIGADAVELREVTTGETLRLALQ